jgi:hypothetical protein
MEVAGKIVAARDNCDNPLVAILITVKERNT